MRDYEFYYTQDGSIGLFSYADDDVYHSKFGALTEAWEKFVIPSEISERLNDEKQLRILDVCYGIGYNTKALMSYMINSDEKFLKKENFLKKIFRKIFKKKSQDINSIVSIDNNNINAIEDELLVPLETIDKENLTIDDLSKIKIDCLEINEELVKISPLLKTVITPQEVYSKIIPKIFQCFETYWKIKHLIARIYFKFLPKNSRTITEMLDLKFSNDYDEIENEYRVNDIANHIIIDSLVEKFKTKYITENIKKMLSDRRKKKFFDNSMLNYIKFKEIFRYDLSSKFNLGAFLHNIYYEHLSKRYNNIKYLLAKQVFDINFHIDDARASILNLSGQYDYIFLDAFTYSKAPQLWTVEFIAELYHRLSPKGVLMTYSNSALVRNTLIENNFYVGKIYNKKTNKYIGTIAAKEKSLIRHPLNNYELGLCATKAGIPYRDPGLNSDKEVILKRREMEFKTSDLIPSSKYMRLRGQTTKDNNNE